MTIEQRISAFSALGEQMRQPTGGLRKAMENASLNNAWYTPDNVARAVQAFSNLLEKVKLENWLRPYFEAFKTSQDMTVGLVLAGNIPLVGFHDLLTTLIAGFSVQVKLSSDDRILTAYLLESLQQLEPAFRQKISVQERLQSYDLIIATGSNNTSRYFDYYFGHVPHIIRKNRNSAAVLTGSESGDELFQLGHDLFDYFGLGCRNVSKLFVPEGYDFIPFFEAIESFKDIGQHHKYANNYDYNKSIYLVNGDKHLDNGFLLLKEDERIASPLAVAYYEAYQHPDHLAGLLQSHRDGIQCLISNQPFPDTGIPCFPFGQSQMPALDDYADGVNTLAFLATYA